MSIRKNSLGCLLIGSALSLFVIPHAPQYGGYCAMAMTVGKLEDIDPNQFLVHGRELLLQRNERGQMMFAKDPVGNQKKADENWAQLQAQQGN